MSGGETYPAWVLFAAFCIGGITVAVIVALAAIGSYYQAHRFDPKPQMCKGVVAGKPCTHLAVWGKDYCRQHLLGEQS